MLGAGTVLAPMGEGRELALDPERALALLSVTAGRSVPARVLEGIAAAARHWSRGDAALANLRLVFAGLPRLEEPQALHKLRAADWLLGNGRTPRALMRELGLDASALDAAPSDDLGKYNPAQPRVPAGNGIESGRWSGADAFGFARPDGPFHVSQLWFDTVEVAQNGPFVPGGTTTTLSTVPNPLDPAGLNKTPPSPAEQQAIMNTLNVIASGSMLKINMLQPHRFRNLPHKDTGAMMPPAVVGYKAYDVITAPPDRGEGRLLIDGSLDRMYYTNQHYKSFFRVRARAVPSP